MRVFIPSYPSVGPAGHPEFANIPGTTPIRPGESHSSSIRRGEYFRLFWRSGYAPGYVKSSPCGPGLPG